MPLFNRNQLHLKPLNQRKHDIDLTIMMNLQPQAIEEINNNIQAVAKKIIQAKKNNRSIIFIMGGHVIRSGAQRYLMDLMRRGYLSLLAMNGACVIHDYEYALIGATTESVSYYIQRGEFGLWKETSVINDIINLAYNNNPQTGYGFAVGKTISQGDYPHKEISILANAYQYNIPATVHIGIGYDIIHEHPNFNGASTGALTYNDFLIFVSALENLEGGVVMNFGSAVMAPEVYLKALSMARNVAHQNNSMIKHFTTMVCDLHDLPDNYSSEPPKSSPAYYFRPWKTMLARTVADGGTSYYVQGRHQVTIPQLWNAINHYEREVS